MRLPIKDEINLAKDKKIKKAINWLVTRNGESRIVAKKVEYCDEKCGKSSAFGCNIFYFSYKFQYFSIMK